MRYRILTILILFPLWLSAQQITGVVSYVSDGDTFYMTTTEGKKETIRVADIDCPETPKKHNGISSPGQPYGYEAKAFTISQIKGKTVTLQVKSVDRWGRKIAFVSYEGKDLSEELLKAGFAWHYVRYSDREDFAALERKAKGEKLGLWRDPEPTAPWIFRKFNKS